MEFMKRIFRRCYLQAFSAESCLDFHTKLIHLSREKSSEVTLNQYPKDFTLVLWAVKSIPTVCHKTQAAKGSLVI